MFYSIRYANPHIIISPHSILEKYYPGIEAYMAENIADNNGSIDILFLGGSVLHARWGRIEQELKEKLRSAYSCGINIHNMPIPTHTSLDSRIKHHLLDIKQYNIILLYHRSNEVRFNNCPSDFLKMIIPTYRFIHTYLHSILPQAGFPFSLVYSMY